MRSLLVALLSVTKSSRKIINKYINCMKVLGKFSFMFIESLKVANPAQKQRHCSQMDRPQSSVIMLSSDTESSLRVELRWQLWVKLHCSNITTKRADYYHISDARWLMSPVERNLWGGWHRDVKVILLVTSKGWVVFCALLSVLQTLALDQTSFLLFHYCRPIKLEFVVILSM